MEKLIISQEEREILWAIYDVLGISFNGETKEELDSFIKKYYDCLDEFSELFVD